MVSSVQNKQTTPQLFFEIASFIKLSLCGKNLWHNRLGKVKEEMQHVCVLVVIHRVLVRRDTEICRSSVINFTGKRLKPVGPDMKAQ